MTDDPRRPIQILNLKFPECANVFGDGLCEAGLGDVDTSDLSARFYKDGPGSWVPGSTLTRTFGGVLLEETGGASSVIGSGALQAAVAEVAGVGTQLGVKTGTGALSMTAAQLSASGAVSGTVAGTGALTAAATTMSGSGTVTAAGEQLVDDDNYVVWEDALRVTAVPSGTTNLEYQVNGGSWVSLGSAATGNYALTGMTEGGNLVKLRAVNGAAAAGTTNGNWCIKAPADPRSFRGWTPTTDHGTTGDYFVDALDGDDANAGTSVGAAKQTLGAALTLASNGDVVKVRAGVYRERETIPFGVTVEGYGAEKPIITAQEKLTSWTQCASPTDDAAIGSTLAASGNVYKKTGISQPSGFAEVMALNLFEAGQRLFHAADKDDTTDLFARGDDRTFHVADSFGLDGSNRILTITDAAVITSAKYTNAQLIGAKVYLYHNPNITSPVTITAADVANNEITVDGLLTVQGNTATPDADDLRYSIMNIGANLTQGTFHVVDQGSTFDVYVYPNDANNVDLIEYSERERVLELANGVSTNGIVIRGLQVHGATGEDTGGGLNIYKGDSGNTSSNHRINNVLSTGCENWGDVARSMRFVRVDATYVEECTFYDHMGGRGIFMSSAGGVAGTDNMVRGCIAQRIGGAGIYAYDQTDYVCAHNLFKDCGLDSHSNKSNHYGVGAGFNGLLFWGNEFDNCVGYVVWQDAANPNVAFNFAPVLQSGAPWNRTITDDNQVFADIPENDTIGRIFNNTVPPTFGITESGKAIDIARPNSDIIYRVANNVTHGINDTGDFTGTHTATPTLFKSNVITYLDSGQVAGDWDSTHVVEETIANVYNDYANYDYSPATSSPILTTSGEDMQSDITTIAARFTQFTDTDKDYKNQTISWTDPFVGADSGLTWDHDIDGDGALTTGAVTVSGSGSVTTSGGGAAFVAAQEMINSTAYQGSAYTYTSGTDGGADYTPTSNSNVLVFIVSTGAANAIPTVKWRGVTLTASVSNLDTVLYMDAVGIYVVSNPGTTAGELTVETADDTNCCIAHVMEFSGVTGAVAQSSSVESSSATSLTEETVTLTGTTSGNMLAGTTIFGGDAAALTASDGCTLALDTRTGTSGTSDNRMGSLYEEAAGGSETMGTTTSGASHSLAMMVELTAS